MHIIQMIKMVYYGLICVHTELRSLFHSKSAAYEEDMGVAEGGIGEYDMRRSLHFSTLNKYWDTYANVIFPQIDRKKNKCLKSGETVKNQVMN